MAKSYEELTFADDFMFCKIMESNQDLCRELTELILGRKIGGILTIDKQKPIEVTPDGRGVRFDIYMKEDNQTVYNIEMQAGPIDELPCRTRYYQGMIDLDLMEHGTKFNELKNSYIIFICLENLFPEIGLHKYSFVTMCRECQNLELGDRSHKIIISAKGDQNDVSEELQAFLTYLTSGTPETDLTKRLDHQVKRARSHIEWRKEYMTLLERDERMREEGRKEGREEERANTLREKARADEEKARADEEKARADEEKARADEEKARADEIEKKLAILEKQLSELRSR